MSPAQGNGSEAPLHQPIVLQMGIKMSSVLPGLDSNQQPSGVLLRKFLCDSRSNQLNVPWKIELRLTSLKFVPDSRFSTGQDSVDCPFYRSTSYRVLTEASWSIY